MYSDQSLHLTEQRVSTHAHALSLPSLDPASNSSLMIVAPQLSSAPQTISQVFEVLLHAVLAPHTSRGVMLESSAAQQPSHEHPSRSDRLHGSTFTSSHVTPAQLFEQADAKFKDEAEHVGEPKLPSPLPSGKLSRIADRRPDHIEEMSSALSLVMKAARWGP